MINNQNIYAKTIFAKTSDGNFMVSQDGELILVRDENGKYKPTASFYSENRYNMIYARINGEPIQEYVHRLVAEAWIHNPDPQSKIYVNHLDNDKRNNYFGNLEWASPAENNNHCITKGNRSYERPQVHCKFCGTLTTNKSGICNLCERKEKKRKTKEKRRKERLLQCKNIEWSFLNDKEEQLISLYLKALPYEKIAEIVGSYYTKIYKDIERIIANKA